MLLAQNLVDKTAIAKRYDVSVRTINDWMARRLIPHIKVSAKLVRFDPGKCDLALEAYEVKCLAEEYIHRHLSCNAPARTKSADDSSGVMLNGQNGLL